MEENFLGRALPIYPRMSRLALARGLTVAAAPCAHGRALASGSSTRLLCGPVQTNQVSLAPKDGTAHLQPWKTETCGDEIQEQHALIPQPGMGQKLAVPAGAKAG